MLRRGNHHNGYLMNDGLDAKALTIGMEPLEAAVRLEAAVLLEATVRLEAGSRGADSAPVRLEAGSRGADSAPVRLEAGSRGADSAWEHWIVNSSLVVGACLELESLGAGRTREGGGCLLGTGVVGSRQDKGEEIDSGVLDSRRGATGGERGCGRGFIRRGEQCLGLGSGEGLTKRDEALVMTIIFTCTIILVHQSDSHKLVSTTNVDFLVNHRRRCRR